MRALGRAADLSANALSMIERGATSPSVATLVKLARAMDIPVSAFFRQEIERKTVVLCRADSRQRIDIEAGILEQLGGEAFTGRMEPLVITAQAGGEEPRRLAHSGYELVYTLAGRLEYEVDGQPYLLEKDDSLLFAASLLHRWRNAGPGKAQAVVVMAGFEDGDFPSEYHLQGAEER